MARSKFVGRVYEGWQVKGVLNTDSKHKMFLLQEVNAVNPGLIFVRDNDLTALDTGRKVMWEILDAKEKTRTKSPENIFAHEFMLFE